MRAQSKESPLSQYLHRTIVISFHFLFLVLPIYFSFQTSELFEFNKMLLVYGCALVATTAWFLKMASTGTLRFRKTYLDIPILLFISSQLLSTWFSIHPYTSIFGYYSRFHGGLLSSLSYIALFYVAVHELHRHDIYKLIYSLFLGSGIVSVYAILEHFGHSFSCYLSSGGSNFGADCWIQDVQNRVFATFGQPNWLAAYCILLFPVGIYGILSSTKKKTLMFFTVSVLLSWAALIFTKSRSGMLGFLVSVCTTLVLVLYKHHKKSFTSYNKKLSGVLVGLIIIATFFGTPFTPSLITNLRQTPQPALPSTAFVNRLEVGGTDSGDIRKIVWQGAYDVWKRYPVLGSGLETFAYSYYLDRPMEHNHVSEWDFLYNKAHNELLNIMATSGALGLGSYLLLLATFFYHLLRIVSDRNIQDTNKQILAWALGTGVIALSVSNFFGFSTVVVTTVMFSYFAFSVLLSEKDQKVQNFSIPPAGKQAFFILIPIVFILMLHRLVTYRQADILFAAGKKLYASGQFAPALEHLHGAITLSPNQAEFYSELATAYAELSIQLAATDATTAAELEEQAVIYSDAALVLNPQHVNMYKDRSRVFILLSQINQSYITDAQQVLETAISRSPTDPKLVYHLALLEHDLGKNEQSLKLLEQAVEMKPNYEQARFELATQYEALGELEKAIEQHTYIVEHIAKNELSKEKIIELQSVTNEETR